jgi:hypothetical protein
LVQRPPTRLYARIRPRLIEGNVLNRYSFAIFVLASATLSYQILITRFFSVMLYYHFAFAAISIAMLGLTRGAMEVYNKPERYTPEHVAVEFARPRRMVRDNKRWRHDRLPVRAQVVLAISTIVFVKSFAESGVCITLLGFYVVCACMLVGSRQLNRIFVAPDAIAPSIQPTQAELEINSPSRAALAAANTHAREAIE